MDPATSSRPPAEDGELEDGEICDDETEERAPPRRGEGSRARARGGCNSRARKPRQHPHNMRPLLGHQPQDFRLLMPYNNPPHIHGPFPLSHRQQCGPSGPDRPPAVPQGPGELGLLGLSPRSNFWERSHGALGRFRTRGVPNGGRGAWSRGGLAGNNRTPPGRYGPGENRGSPSRKQKQLGRNRARKVIASVPRPESSVDESFEDLLSKYKQIQLELECIRKEETMALEPVAAPVREDVQQQSVPGPREAQPGPEPAPNLAGADDPSELEKDERKAFQAFNIKPLRQKLPTPADLDQLQRKAEQDPGGGGGADGAEPASVDGAETEGKAADDTEEKEKTQQACSCPSESSASSEDSIVSPDKPVEKVEEEELSELQLRLLALQSASKKWQQKEQQVMKKSKDRIVKASQEKNSSSSSAATAPSKQRVATRSTSAAAATAADRTRTRSKPGDRERDRTKPGPRPAEKDRLLERDRLKKSPKPGPKSPIDKVWTPGKPHAKKLTNPGSAAKQAFRKQQLRTWKLQQQRKQEEKRRQEEEERRKREDEIRRIRDLSNQDEQYNRFMKLVGGKRMRNKSRDQDYRKSAGKPGLDTSGNLYQYDNYDEVAMDTDSETSSPAPSPTHNLLSADETGCSQLGLYGAAAAALGMPLLSAAMSSVPAPPPPLPPPPDELEPPPKPPFADEEEEEEMLLRETCLMSMANKRVAVPEKSPSAFASPSCPPPADVQPPPRGNLSTVSLNTVAQSRSSRFPRPRQTARAQLVLPRHKSVVVSLNDSDDSDSDMDACSSSQTVFGGLESMIKEARRTVEAAKPKAASGCEKENNPVRPAEVLPQTERVEYRFLKEEFGREKQRMLKEHSSLSFISPAAPQLKLDSLVKPSVELKLSEAEQRLSKHRKLLQRDEAVLRHLLQQELKKAESLKAAETKVAKLREQLQASEKIVGANRTLLRKLQEQVHCVEQRVSQKKTLAVHLEQELLQAQLAAGRGQKRPMDSSQTLPNKVQRLDAAPLRSERHFAELIAQKRRLQQLESEYALKIQKLKEAQALRNKGVPPEPPAPASVPLPEPPIPSLPAPSTFNVPQPSLHDLSQDKLVLDSEDVPDAEDQEPESTSAAAAPASIGSRRASFRQSRDSFTKPHLDTVSSTPAKDGSTKPVKSTGSSELPAEMFAGLDVDGLKQRYQQQAKLGDLLQRELGKLGTETDTTSTAQVARLEVDASQAAVSEMKPVPFEPYHSPLLVFKSYRFSPYYRTKEKLSLSSVTYSSAVEANRCFCRFDLTGTCNDDGCRWQHMRNCTLTGTQLYQDILSYNLSLIGCSETSSDEDISAATENYVRKLLGQNKDRMGMDQKAVLLVSKVNESKRHVPPFTTFKETRRWRPKPSTQSAASPEDDGGNESAAAYLTPAGGDVALKSCTSAVDVCITSEDRRYFVSETDDISNLESSVLESPRDTQLWIKLAFRYLNQIETSTAECLEAALNTLSRALESNCEDPEVWSHYLLLFSRRGSREEVQEMCEMAVEHAPDYRVWWNYLNLESSFEGKDYVCERLLQFLLAEASSDASEKHSFQLMETLLYRVQLSLFTGRMESALAILQNALKSSQDESLAEHLIAGDRALVWLSYIHLTEFDRLPSSLYDPAESGPARLVSRTSFTLPWRTSQDVSTPPSILIALFRDAVSQCSEESSSESERALACMPLHTNLILLYKLLQRYDEGIALCETLLQLCPESCTLRDALADLHVSSGDAEQAVSMWLHTLAECPHNAQVFYHSCKFLMAQDKSSAIAPLLRGFILSLCEDEQRKKTPVEILRRILGFPTKELLSGPIIKKELQVQIHEQMSFFHLVHCCWMWLHGSVEDAVEAFERALGSSLQLEELHLLWMDYLLFSCSPQASAGSRRLFSDLVQRCFSTVPSRLEVPFNPAEFWSCYQFHNKVVALYLRCVPQSQHALLLEKLRNSMPNNIELGLRLLYQEWQDGNMEQLKFQARMLCSTAHKYLPSWSIAIAVERELKDRAEMRLLYQQALQNLPLCAALWKHCLLFEAAEGGASELLRSLADCCQQVGVSVSLSGVRPSIADDL
ncbi:zinc finger C3H1 domain-containing protein-like isoform X2 [Cololabis saira]|uniref:zinc finger C3H1 domain-containing protein-like isoform X2 n=1 Tax=Cololabis saira TaxID=129043 RepID=UPI002AD3132F|nr:zinc finger C3H1 domain-containing protein-like isoform X2 [Cololabis saira]